MKKIFVILLLNLLFLQPLSTFAIDNNIRNINYEVKRQTKEQYTYKKVNKKYDAYLINIENKNKDAILISKDTNLEFVNIDNSIQLADTRRAIYFKTRSRDIGKYWGITLPCSILAGGIVGITFGIGIPVAIGVIILGGKPAANASKINYNCAEEMYNAHMLPLRIESNQLYQVRLLLPKKSNISKIRFTNLAFANHYDKKLQLEIVLPSNGEKLDEK